MQLNRRNFIAASGAMALGALGLTEPLKAQNEPNQRMFGLLSKITAYPTRRDPLIAVLLEGTHDMPGCLSYVVARDTSDPDSIWVTEVWESQEAQKASFTLPAVQNAMRLGRPMITSFREHIVTEPMGGVGLK